MEIKSKIKIILLSFLLFSTSLIFYSVSFYGKAKIYFFDVGQGDSILIQNEKNTQILIDGGPSKKVLEKLGDVMPFYDRTLELVILTHPDKDHLFGIVEVLKRYNVEKIIFPDIQDNSAGYQEFLKLVQAKNIPIIFPNGQERIIFSGGYLDILYPLKNFQNQKLKNTNDASIITRLVFKNQSFLLTGDADQKIEKNLIKNNLYLSSNILKVGHHGSKNSTSDIFLQAVSPQEAVISVGKNSYGHPHQEILNKLENIIIKRTDQDGDVLY